MQQQDLEFAENTLSAEERLTGFFSLSRGLVHVMNLFFHRVSGYHDLLAEEVAGNSAAEDYLERSRDALQTAGNWLKRFGGSFSCRDRFEPVDANLMLAGAARRCRKVLSEDRSLTFEAGEEEILVRGALFQLQELFMKGILRTARDLMPEAHELVLDTMVRQYSRDYLNLMTSSCPGGRYFTVLIRKPNAEFAPDKLVPFLETYLGERAVSANPDLALHFLELYGILVSHGGDAFLQKDGNGDLEALVFVLPEESPKGEEDMQVPHNIEDARLMGQETILLVDDEDMIWDVIIDMLQELGYTVILAANGRDAVEIYKANPGEFDLVLLDMVMPEMDGYTAFFELKKADPTVKVLLSSGYVSEDDAREVMDAGAVGFLQKPYRMQDLARKIRTIFDNSAVAI